MRRPPFDQVRVASDVLVCFGGLADAGLKHEAIVTGKVARLFLSGFGHLMPIDRRIRVLPDENGLAGSRVRRWRGRSD
jgi:hypothetical protein